MIESKIKEIAERNGIKTPYGPQRALNVVPSVAARLWRGDVTRFSVEILDKLCEKFDCGVGDLLVYQKPPSALADKSAAEEEHTLSEAEAMGMLGLTNKEIKLRRAELGAKKINTGRAWAFVYRPSLIEKAAAKRK